ncbi:MAG TPA: TonB family protein [Terriglobales bacterium]|nr:TonB family protein [Terriglobales bacterium]
MSRSQTFLGMVLLATSIVAFSQTTDTKPPDSGDVVRSQGPTPTAMNPCAVDAKRFEQGQILTDTMGVDFGPYLTQVAKTVRQNWYSVMPPSVYPPVKKQGRVSIEFVIQKDGKVTGEKVGTSSGDVALDRAAYGSLSGSSPFAPLPKEFPGQESRFRFYFFYNLTPDTTLIYISPCIDVRVPVGSTFQFSVPIGGIERAAATWSVSGPACEKAACGTISETGLYTAPTDVPNPPTVFVEVTPRSDRSFPAQVQLTVVRAGPSH